MIPRDGSPRHRNERTGKFCDLCFLMALCVHPVSAGAKESLGPFTQCRSVRSDAERLKCFDAAVKALAAPTFQGGSVLLTEPFELKGPAMLRFQSDGAIFVLYVKSADERCFRICISAVAVKTSTASKTPAHTASDQRQRRLAGVGRARKSRNELTRKRMRPLPY